MPGCNSGCTECTSTVCYFGSRTILVIPWASMPWIVRSWKPYRAYSGAPSALASTYAGVWSRSASLQPWATNIDPAPRPRYSGSVHSISKSVAVSIQTSLRGERRGEYNSYFCPERSPAAVSLAVQISPSNRPCPYPYAMVEIDPRDPPRSPCPIWHRQ